MIPLSTAVFDPAWYHSKGKQWKDKNGVWNGIRAEVFMPGQECEGLCHGRPCAGTPDSCSFLKTYKTQLDKLNFSNIWERLEKIGNQVKEAEGFNEKPIPILIVHEATTNPCSERWVLKEWFKEHGYELEEFNKNLV